MGKHLTAAEIELAKAKADAEIERIKDECARRRGPRARVEYLEAKLDDYNQLMEEIIGASPEQIQQFKEQTLAGAAEIDDKLSADAYFRKYEKLTHGWTKWHLLPLSETHDLIFDRNARFRLISHSTMILVGDGQEVPAVTSVDFEEWLLSDLDGRLTVSDLRDHHRDPLKLIEYRRIWLELLDYADILRKEIPDDTTADIIKVPDDKIDRLKLLYEGARKEDLISCPWEEFEGHFILRSVGARKPITWNGNAPSLMTFIFFLVVDGIAPSLGRPDKRAARRYVFSNELVIRHFQTRGRNLTAHDLSSARDYLTDDMKLRLQRGDFSYLQARSSTGRRKAAK